MSFCKNCGYMFLSENDNMCGNCGTPRGQGNKFCSNCGASVSPEQNNCTMCGYFVGKTATANNASQPQNNFNNTATATPNNFQGTAFDPNNNINVNAGYPVNQPNANNNLQKSRLAAGLLGVFLGGFGIHNFYLGYTNKAILQLVLTIVGIITSCIFVGIFLVMGIGIWGFIEGLMILIGKTNVDANGVPLKND